MGIMIQTSRGKKMLGNNRKKMGARYDVYAPHKATLCIQRTASCQFELFPENKFRREPHWFTACTQTPSYVLISHTYPSPTIRQAGGRRTRTPQRPSPSQISAPPTLILPVTS